MTDYKKSAKYLLNFLDKFKLEIEDQIQILSLRPKLNSTLQSNFDGDFDFLIRETDFQKVLEILYDLSKNLGINFELNQRAQNKKLFTFFIEDIDALSLTLEFWINIEFSCKKKRFFFSGQDIYDAIEFYNTSAFEILSLLFITHLNHKNKNIDSEENIFRFEFFLNNLSKENQTPQNLNTISLLQKTRDKLLTKQDANIRALKILNNYQIKDSSSFIQMLTYFKYRIRNKFLNLKKITPIIGPDGVGKGSVSEKSLIKLTKWSSFRFKQLYRLKLFYRLRLSLLANSKKEPKNKSDEKIGYYIFIVAFLIIRALCILKSNRILLDRYFTDYFASPIRYLAKNKSPAKLGFYKSLLFFTPVPNHTVFLGCSDASLISRKNELPIISVDYLQKLNCEFIVYKKAPKVLFISTENQTDITSEVLFRYLKNNK
tara:strand:- start:2507 stop:3796 length:1290 start_codon:yes stop_codon:yes gene_type:complete